MRKRRKTNQKEQVYEPVAPIGITLRGPFEYKKINSDWYGIKSTDQSIEIMVRGEANSDFVETSLNLLYEEGFL